MAMRQQPAESLADRVKLDLQTPSTISHITLNLLRALLGLDLVDNNTTTAVEAKPKNSSRTLAKVPAQPSARKSSVPKFKAKLDFKIHHGTSTPAQPLPLERRRALATETFNTTLKQLSGQVKKRQDAGTAHSVTTPRTSPQIALQARSPNRRTLAPLKEKVTGTNKAAGPLDDQDSSLRITVDCAMAAVRCLAELGHDTDSSATDAGDALLRGSQILLDRLIALGLTAQAEEQMWQVRGQLCARLGEPTRPIRAKTSMSSALLFTATYTDAKVLGIIAMFQLQVLKVGNLAGANFVDQTLLQSLDPSNASSPVAICIRTMQSGAMTEDKAGQYLYGLSMILSRSCSVIRGSQLCSLGTLDRVQLTIAVLTIRCHSWKMLGHKINVEKELWSPLSRALQDYSETCDASQPAALGIIKKSIMGIQKLLAGMGHGKPLPTSIAFLLVEVAQRSGSTEQTLVVLGDQLLIDERTDGLAGVVNRCRATTIILGDPASETRARLVACELALSVLKTSLKGTASELRDLLLHSARLRKAATATALDAEKSIHQAQVEEDDIKLQTCSIRLLYAITRFVLRYFGQANAPNRGSGNFQGQMETQSAVSNSARNTVDCVLSVMKCRHVRSVLLWDETEIALTDCLELRTLIRGGAVSEPNKVSSKQVPPSVNLRVSNIYWAWYLYEKDAKFDTRHLCLLLERSIEALKPCKVDERILAFEVVKCERLASCYQTLGECKKAKFALVGAIEASIAQGALDEAVEIALSKPARMAWTDPKLKAHILGSCLRKLGRASAEHDAQKLPDQIAFFDDEELPDLHRAQVLEIQLFAVAELPATAFTRAHCTNLAKQVLSLCQQPHQHVYRIRFIRDMLNLAAKHTQFPLQDILNDELIQTACTFQQVNSTSPSLLISYGPLLCLSVLLQWAFLTSRPSRDCLRGLIDSTASLVLQCHDSAELDNAVDDPESLLRHVSAAAEYAGMLDMVEVRLKALQAVRQILQNRTGADATRLVACLTDIGRTTARLGNTSDAGRCFAEAEKLLGNSDKHTESRLSWCVAYSSYLISLEAYEKGAEMIDAAQLIYAELTTQLNSQDQGSDRLKQESHLSNAALAMSELAFRQGDLRSAIIYARQCVKLTSGLWAALEKLFHRIKDHLDASGVDMTQVSVDEVSNTTLTLDQSSLQTVVKGAPFWAHIDMHFRALLHMSTLCAHCGLYPDAVYYATLASKLSTLLTSEERQFACRVQLVLLHAKGGHTAEAKLLINAVRATSFKDLPDLEISKFSLDLAAAALSLNDPGSSDQYLERARVSCSKVNSPTSNVHVGPSPVVRIAKEMMALTITGKKGTKGSKSSITPAARKNAPASGKGTQTPAISNKGRSPTPTKTLACPMVARLQEAQGTLALQIQLRKGKAARAASTFQPSLALIQPTASREKKLIQATILLNEALTLFGSDAVHCVLAETALAYPSRYSTRRPSGRVSALSAATVSVKAKASTRARQKQQQGNDNLEINEGSPESMLRTAYELLASACAVGSDKSSSDIVHDVQKLFCRLSMLANAVGLSLSYSPTKILTESLKSKDAVLSRECFVLDADQPSSSKSELRKWPTVPTAPGAIPDGRITGNVVALASTFDEMPETWSVVSISLNDAKTEMLLSRASSGTTPLILRIPLARSAIDDAEENEFTFNEAKEELVDIIENANSTAHDSRSQAEKTARKLWWAEREALDHRLETLLLNVENIWLGGFRGILSQQRKSDEEMLSKFSSSLDAALEQNLPSRQKTGATCRNKVRLHAHVLDLFVALGHPDECELDDAITDLLYFVVDILQFEGERNAYDEIDFDAMLVDVLDALRSYHEGCPADNIARHTILILDKELHAFPWESLPCLHGKSVSRMPSIGMIQTRLAKIHAQSSDADAYTIPASRGGYILNPSADLPSTETTFVDIFTQQLPAFTSITSRKPTEPEFESLLHSSSLLLYFGHGSGAQYIRGRRIKQLDQCAVTFLMGCSSGKMTECGAYESYGVPWNYMHAGSMAVVGTLWDVTDRDIDRFALAAFEEWGLLVDAQGDEKARKKTEARRRKGVVRKVAKGTSRKGKGLVALDEAVNRAREACVLRYLNGAAVAMYGLPVMLE